MDFQDNLRMLASLFDRLQNTSSTIEKSQVVDSFKKTLPEFADDLDFCFEVMSGRHKLGYTLQINDTSGSNVPASCSSLRNYCAQLFNVEGHDAYTLSKLFVQYRGAGWFLNPLFNREWRIGINKSQLKIDDLTPMLAKKLDTVKLKHNAAYVLTEKLDGNRCLAHYSIEETRWIFTSRSGKEMRVQLNMCGLNHYRVYDGEILSRSQLKNPSQANFNALSGAINSIYGNKDELVYKVFDIVMNMPYSERRSALDKDFRARITPENNNVELLPVLAYADTSDMNAFMKIIKDNMEEITNAGGEGVMLNLCSSPYIHKRTDALIKVKNTYTMDMKVTGLEVGTGKYDGLIGSLICIAKDPETGFVYSCNVGSGLSDYQRSVWATSPNMIIGQIVEVAYFSASQNKDSMGTVSFSLRFPRLKRVRMDKEDTSVD